MAPRTQRERVRFTGAHTRTGIKDGVLTVERLDTHATVSLPWPPPPLPAGRLGAWMPVVLARHEDGSATGAWAWEDQVSVGRADESPTVRDTFLRTDTPPEDAA